MIGLIGYWLLEDWLIGLSVIFARIWFERIPPIISNLAKHLLYIRCGYNFIAGFYSLRLRKSRM
jgi:hypothetical protein